MSEIKEICRLENVTKVYNMGENVCTLKNANLTINSGDFISIEGPSGIGKSTLLYLMGGMLKANDGSIFVMGQDITTMHDKDLTNLRKDYLGFLFQETHLFQALSIRENLTFTAELNKRGVTPEEIEEMIENLGLEDRADYLPHQLSVGQRRRVVAARALLGKPSFILADEPTNDLDEIWSEKIVGLLAEAAKNGAGVIMVTHNPVWAKRTNLHYKLLDGGLVLC